MSKPSTLTAAPATGTVIIRDATDADMPAVQTIYAHHVLNGLASFEEVAPDVTEMTRRRAEIIARRLPYRVAEVGGMVAGFAYASSFRPRPAYRNTVENSIYVDPGATGQGIGRRLLQDLIELCTGLGYRQMVAVIGDSANAASIGLHASLGFRMAGTLRSTGFKLGEWVDTVIMQRSLGPGDREPPSA